MKTTVVLSEARQRRPLVLVGPLPPPWGDVSVHLEGLVRMAEEVGLEVTVLDTARHRHLGRELARAAGAGAILHAHTRGDSLRAWMLALVVAGSRLPGRQGGLLSVHGGGASRLLHRSPTARALARATAAGMSRIVCSSEDAAVALGRAGVDPDKLEVVPDFVPAGPGTPPPLALTARGRFDPLLVVPADTRAPGILGLLADALDEVGREMPRAGALLVGPGVPGTPGPRLIHGGEVPHPAALATLALADLVVRPSAPDTDAMPVREALSLGVRVLASNSGHRPPAARLFRSGDAADLAAGIVASLQGPPPPPEAAGADPRPRILRLWRGLGVAPRAG